MSFRRRDERDHPPHRLCSGIRSRREHRLVHAVRRATPGHARRGPLSATASMESRSMVVAAMLIVDAGPLYAAAATRDRHHKTAVELLTTAPRPLIVPALVVTEVSYLLVDRIGPHAEVAFA